jgi:hypothetical protein
MKVPGRAPRSAARAATAGAIQPQAVKADSPARATGPQTAGVIPAAVPRVAAVHRVIVGPRTAGAGKKAAEPRPGRLPATVAARATSKGTRPAAGQGGRGNGQGNRAAPGSAASGQTTPAARKPGILDKLRSLFGKKKPE